MKNRTLIFTLFTLLFGFSFALNVHAESAKPEITKVTNMLSTQIKVNYKLSSCDYEKCGIIVVIDNWVYKYDGAMSLRASGEGYKIYENLNRGETYSFRVALYWFDENGGYHNSAYSKPVTIKAEAPKDKVVGSIEITKEPTKTTYKAGEKFDPTGMKIKVNYTTGDTGEIIDGKGCTFTPEQIESSTTAVRVSCDDDTVYQKITVNGSIGTDSKITTLKKKSDPSKVTYKVGEKFDPTGLVLEADYEDGTTGDINVKDAVSNNICKITPDGALTKNDTEVTITCGNAPYKQKITVSGTTEPTKEIQEVTNVSGNPSKTTYSEGETFNPNGMKMDVTYKDGTKGTIDVSADQCAFTPSTLTSSTTKVTVKCGNVTKDVSVTVGVCTPDTPTISKSTSSSDTWADGLYARGGSNCGLSGTIYEWDTSATFSSPVSGMSYKDEKPAGTTIYLRACYNGRCSVVPASIRIGVDTVGPKCTITYQKTKNGNETYTCGRWTKYDVYAKFTCTDNYTGVKTIKQRIKNSNSTKEEDRYTVEGLSAKTSSYTSNTLSKRISGTGQLTSYFYAVDHIGNESTTPVCTIKIDQTAPSGGEVSSKSSTKGKLVWTVTTDLTDDDSGLKEFRIEYRKKGSSTWKTAGKDGSGKPFIDPETATGAKKFAKDATAEATCTAGESYEWKVTRKDVATNETNTGTPYTKTCPSS